jgi:hypothetical protein
MFNLRRSEHISDVLICLHLLRTSESIRFKMATLVYRAIHGLLPSYLSSFAPVSFGLGAFKFKFGGVTQAAHSTLPWLFSAIVLFRLPALLFGMTCRWT